MFEQLRDSLKALSDRLGPEEQRRVTASMRDALMHAKLAISDLRDAAGATSSRLEGERTELETVRRRQGLASQIGDAETVAIADKFAAQHAERVAMLESKLMVQQQELTMVEREYEEMSSQLRLAMSGIAPTAGADRAVSDRTMYERAASARGEELGDFDVGSLADEPSPPARRTRADKEADAESRLAELKRRMGK